MTAFIANANAAPPLLDGFIVYFYQSRNMAARAKANCQHEFKSAGNLKNHHSLILVEFGSQTLSSVLAGRHITEFWIPTTHSFTASWLLQLTLDNEVLLELRTDPVHAGGWEEVGVLCVRLVSNFQEQSRRNIEGIGAQIVPFSIEKVELLIDERPHFRAESGILLTNEKGEDFIVVAGVPPGSVSICMPFNRQEFAPEANLSVYKREPLGTR